MRPLVKYHIIYLNGKRYSICSMCRFFDISRSGYDNFVHHIGKKAHDYFNKSLSEISIGEGKIYILKIIMHKRFWC